MEGSQPWIDQQPFRSDGLIMGRTQRCEWTASIARVVASAPKWIHDSVTQNAFLKDQCMVSGWCKIGGVFLVVHRYIPTILPYYRCTWKFASNCGWWNGIWIFLFSLLRNYNDKNLYFFFNFKKKSFIKAIKRCLYFKVLNTFWILFIFYIFYIIPFRTS